MAPLHCSRFFFISFVCLLCIISNLFADNKLVLRSRASNGRNADEISMMRIFCTGLQRYLMATLLVIRLHAFRACLCCHSPLSIANQMKIAFIWPALVAIGRHCAHLVYKRANCLKSSSIEFSESTKIISPKTRANRIGSKLTRSPISVWLVLIALHWSKQITNECRFGSLDMSTNPINYNRMRE